ncbi:Os05g0254800 [Oryza sativa Japonica Group]|uniref:Os05g0254800 protein n=1 Tax=Oryza sativa subsp. japonica TaxID=39947 RepID=A0A0P0WJW1_ORYSJ|nr:Os05g0254800 [Oryza sativa Japonica Group]
MREGRPAPTQKQKPKATAWASVEAEGNGTRRGDAALATSGLLAFASTEGKSAAAETSSAAAYTSLGATVGGPGSRCARSDSLLPRRTSASASPPSQSTGQSSGTSCAWAGRERR